MPIKPSSIQNVEDLRTYLVEQSEGCPSLLKTRMFRVTVENKLATQNKIDGIRDGARKQIGVELGKWTRHILKTMVEQAGAEENSQVPQENSRTWHPNLNWYDRNEGGES